MKPRSMARRCALQILYQLDLDAEPMTVEAATAAFYNYWHEYEYDDKVKDFAQQLVQGIVKHHQEIDEIISKTNSRWRIERMAPIDRNILRLGSYELSFLDTPAAVVINEAVEIAKEFGAQQSASFVNGILDEIKRKNK